MLGPNEDHEEGELQLLVPDKFDFTNKENNARN